MSVQKITGLSQRSKSLNSSTAIKNTFLSGISFKGYTKQVTTNNGTRPWTEYGTSGRFGTSGCLHHDGQRATVNKYDIQHPDNTNVTDGNDGYVSQDYDSATVKVYYADPGEKITDKIKDNHAYIVEYEKMPDIVSEEKINNATKTSELKEYIATLEKRAELLGVNQKIAAENLESAKDALDIARSAYQSAQNEYNDKMQNKAAKDLEIKNNSERLKLAKDRFKAVKADEEAAYKAHQKRKALEEMHTKLGQLNDNSDNELSAIFSQLTDYLNSHKGKSGK